ncbi:MAG: hypothetical protein LiPW15_753 [Parcubacteria group bacterium LiPW_15]|nr:MAG: hypothetical protein LiPW15_753 [Parcubacteria group bacterium LiPW_15]
MVINYFGNGTLRLQSGEISLLIDPEGNRLKADVYLFTSSELKEGEVFSQDTINFPGEYEAHGIEIVGAQIPEESSGNKVRTAYLVTMEGIKIAILGDAKKIPPVEVLERLEEPDILILPAEKGKYLSPEDADKLAKQLEPAVVIPSRYGNVNELGKAFEKKVELQEKFVCKKKDLERGKIELVVLQEK